MDIDTLHSLLTVVAFFTFLGIVSWAFSSAQKTRFEQAARLPFEEDEPREAVSGDHR